MENFYLNIKAGAFSFLISLDSVIHIYTSQPVAGPAEYEGRPVMVHRIGPLLGRALGEETHAVLLSEEGEYHALLVEQVNGLEQICSDDLREIPREVLGADNRFLSAAVKLGDGRGWAYLLDLPTFFHAESKDMTDDGCI